MFGSLYSASHYREGMSNIPQNTQYKESNFKGKNSHSQAQSHFHQIKDSQFKD